MKRTVDLAGVLLLSIAAAGVWMSHGPRREAAEFYAQAAAYNRSLTAFVAQNAAALRERTVAVFGLTGLSPWSVSAGAYLTKLAGSPVAWQVYVPKTDIFYPSGRTASGHVDVRLEAGACETVPADVTYLVFDNVGRGAFTTDCDAALARAHPAPTIDAWGPKSVSAEQAAAGFDMFFTGIDLAGSVDVSVAGKSLGMVRAKQGRLMTTSIPARSDADGVVRFSIDHRGRSVGGGEVRVE